MNEFQNKALLLVDYTFPVYDNFSGFCVRRGYEYLHSYDTLVETMLSKPVPSYKWMRCVTPSWDNTARRKEGAHIFLGAEPEKYRKWLSNIVEDAKQRLDGDEQVVFLNAWNEWAEGNHLEPDLKWGHAYLEATRDALLPLKDIHSPISSEERADSSALTLAKEDAGETSTAATDDR